MIFNEQDKLHPALTDFDLTFKLLLLLFQSSHQITEINTYNDCHDINAIQHPLTLFSYNVEMGPE